ncbi:hypothetical protein Tco_0355051 [Tanacetum coccineum]
MSFHVSLLRDTIIIHSCPHLYLLIKSPDSHLKSRIENLNPIEIGKRGVHEKQELFLCEDSLEESTPDVRHLGDPKNIYASSYPRSDPRGSDLVFRGVFFGYCFASGNKVSKLGAGVAFGMTYHKWLSRISKPSPRTNEFGDWVKLSDPKQVLRGRQPLLIRSITHWFTLIVLSALRRSDNENMLSYDDLNTYVLERFKYYAGKSVKEILLKLNLLITGQSSQIRRLCKMVDGGSLITAGITRS